MVGFWPVVSSPFGAVELNMHGHGQPSESKRPSRRHQHKAPRDMENVEAPLGDDGAQDEGPKSERHSKRRSAILSIHTSPSLGKRPE